MYSATNFIFYLVQKYKYDFPLHLTMRLMNTWFFFFKFTHKSQNLLVPSLIFLLSISKLEAPSNHLKPLKKKKKGLFLWGIFWRLKETFAFVFVGFFSSFLPEYLIQFQKKTREFITDYCDNTLITVNYRVLKCLFITMSLLI